MSSICSITTLLQLEHVIERADDALFLGFLTDIGRDYGVPIQVVVGRAASNSFTIGEGEVKFPAGFRRF